MINKEYCLPSTKRCPRYCLCRSNALPMSSSCSSSIIACPIDLPFLLRIIWMPSTPPRILQSTKIKYINKMKCSHHKLIISKHLQELEIHILTKTIKSQLVYNMCCIHFYNQHYEKIAKNLLHAFCHQDILYLKVK